MYLTSNVVSQIPVYPLMTLFDTVRPPKRPVSIFIPSVFTSVQRYAHSRDLMPPKCKTIQAFYCLGHHCGLKSFNHLHRPVSFVVLVKSFVSVNDFL